VCKVKKPISEYSADRKEKTGVRRYCRECGKKTNQKYRKENFIAIQAYRNRTKEYHNKQNREYRKTEKYRQIIATSYRKHKEAYQPKQIARRAVYSAIRAGRLKRLPCSVCGNPKSQGHHEDYSKPLDVVWLCVKHHKELHSERGYAEKLASYLKQAGGQPATAEYLGNAKGDVG
tara:strand:+ start:520 stop:1044 length:525 start_codon:yes stop_codon:yes gene_type:complete